MNEKDSRKWRKKYLMVDGYMFDKILNKIKKMIDIEQTDTIKIFIDIDDELPHITWYGMPHDM